MRTVVYTAEIDDRFGSGKVSSRIGLSSPARLYNTQTALFTEHCETNISVNPSTAY